MGVRFQRSADAAPGKTFEVVAFAAEIAEYFTQHFGVTVTWGMEIGGDYGRIHWFGDYDDLAHFEAVMRQSTADAEYMRRVVEGEQLFRNGSAKDTLIWAP